MIELTLVASFVEDLILKFVNEEVYVLFENDIVKYGKKFKFVFVFEDFDEFLFVVVRRFVDTEVDEMLRE